MRPTELAYAAGFIDGEGTFLTVGRRGTGGARLLRPALQACNCDRAPLDILATLFGGGVSRKRPRGTRSAIYEWRVSGERAIVAAVALTPYLVIKRAHAELFPAFGSPGRGRGIVPVDEIERRAALARQLKDLNRAGFMRAPSASSVG